MYWTRIMHWCPNDSGINNMKHKPRHEFLASSTDRVNCTYKTWISVANNCSLNYMLHSTCYISVMSSIYVHIRLYALWSIRWHPGLKMLLVLIGPHVCHHIGLKFCSVCSVGIKYIYTFLQQEEPRHEMSVPLRVLQRNVDSPLNHSTSPSSPCYSRTFRGSPPYR